MSRHVSITENTIRPLKQPDPLIVSDRSVLGGTPVFAGTRVPVVALFEHVDDGESLDEFLRQYPTVSRTMAQAVMAKNRAQLVLDFTLLLGGVYAQLDRNAK